MYKDYLDDIFKYYRAEERNAKLSQRLIAPTPGDLKKECIAVYKARFHKKDLSTLISFFGVEGDPETILRAIRNFDREKFKPLANFLCGKTNKTDDLNIELLAWLTNFSKRPYTPENYFNNPVDINGYNPNAEEAQKSVQNNVQYDTQAKNLKSKDDIRLEDVFDHERAEEVMGKPIGLKRKPRKNLLAMVVLLPLLVGFYFVIDRSQESASLKDSQQCMMWVGDHYVQTSCDPRQGDTIVVALDIQRLNNFKLITRPDTITVLSERRLWYIRRNGQIEYYTAGGKHPIDPTKQLRPLTRYMIEKHLNLLVQ